MPGAPRVKNYFFLLLGLFFMGLGVALVTRSALGTPPISSVPYVISLAVPVTFGQLAFLLNVLFLLAEVLIIGRSFPKRQYLQVLVALFFGIFVDAGMFLSAPLQPDFYAGQILLVLVGCAVLALGIYLQVTANVFMVPGDGLVKAIAGKTGVRFGYIKIIFDTSLVCTATLISLLVFGTAVGIREGTVISMLLIGYVVILVGIMFGWFGFEEWLAGEGTGR
jgi:uncharacterized membrane protein YczE